MENNQKEVMNFVGKMIDTLSCKKYKQCDGMSLSSIVNDIFDNLEQVGKAHSAKDLKAFGDRCVEIAALSMVLYNNKLRERGNIYTVVYSVNRDNNLMDGYEYGFVAVDGDGVTMATDGKPGHVEIQQRDVRATSGDAAIEKYKEWLEKGYDDSYLTE